MKPRIKKVNGHWDCEGSFGLTPKRAYEMHLAFEDMNNKRWDEFTRKFESEQGAFFSKPNPKAEIRFKELCEIHSRSLSQAQGA